jgi:SNF2 family DNA or RNA helicase
VKCWTDQKNGQIKSRLFLNLSAAEAQATDRAYRIGQDKPVFVHKLLCQDTVEQRIHQMQQQKAQLAAGLLTDADISQKLSPEMVRALLV